MRDQDAPAPSMDDICTAIEELLNNSCKPKLNTKFTTWKTSSSLGQWETVDPAYYWYNWRQANDDDEEEGQCFFFFEKFNIFGTHFN